MIRDAINARLVLAAPLFARLDAMGTPRTFTQELTQPCLVMVASLFWINKPQPLTINTSDFHVRASDLVNGSRGARLGKPIRGPPCWVVRSGDVDFPGEANTWNMILYLSFHSVLGSILWEFSGWSCSDIGKVPIFDALPPVRRYLVWPVFVLARCLDLNLAGICRLFLLLDSVLHDREEGFRLCLGYEPAVTKQDFAL